MRANTDTRTHSSRCLSFIGALIGRVLTRCRMGANHHAHDDLYSPPQALIRRFLRRLGAILIDVAEIVAWAIVCVCIFLPCAYFFMAQLAEYGW